MRRPIITSIVNHKGGCLKTSLCVNLGAALARAGYRVLLLDLDMQQNLTISLIGQVPYMDSETTFYDALIEETGLDHLIRETNEAGLDVIPCTEDFVDADLSLVNAVGREGNLRACFGRTERLSGYDFVFLDDPPSMSLVVMNSLVASDYFLVPCSTAYLPMVGLALLGDSIEKIQKIAPNLQPLGVVLTLYSRNERICRQTEDALRKQLGEAIWDSKVRVNTKAKSAPSVQKTIFQYEGSAKGRGTTDYTDVAREFVRRVGFVADTSSKAANG